MDLRFKKIKDYTSEELEFAINDAITHCHDHGTVGTGPLKFWTIFRGFDAYMEKRRRKEEAEAIGARGLITG